MSGRSRAHNTHQQPALNQARAGLAKLATLDLLGRRRGGLWISRPIPCWSRPLTSSARSSKPTSSAGSKPELARARLRLCLGARFCLSKSFRSTGFLFESGGSLRYYRQLLAHFQRAVMGLRRQLGPAWEVVTKWSVVEPVEHRPPLPEALLAGFGIALGWYRFVVAVLLSYYCIVRPGEVLKAVRKDILTPANCLDDTGSACIYLKVTKPKTRKRGARVQHCKICAPVVVEFIEAILKPLAADEPIFRGSPSSFRRRWDFILRQIGLPERLRVTPASLRGGGAVWGYRSGLSLTEICWADHEPGSRA